MVNVLGESNGHVNLQIVEKVAVRKCQYKDYANEIRQNYGLEFTPYRLYTNEDGTFLLPFVFMMEGYMYCTMLPRCRLPVDILQEIN